MVRLEIPRKLHSGQYFNNKHWSFRQRDRNLWLAELTYTLGFPKKMPDRLTVTIERVLGPRERLYDEDNLRFGSAKQIVDAIVRLGWAKGDRPGDIVVHYRQTRPVMRAQPRVIITIETEGESDGQRNDSKDSGSSSTS
jgi:hypothetical protein